jgi:hypothetical protein
MPGLVSGIHVLGAWKTQDVDGRDKPGHDDGWAVKDAHIPTDNRSMANQQPQSPSTANEAGDGPARLKIWSSDEGRWLGRSMVTRIDAGKSWRNALARNSSAWTPPAEVPMATTSRLAMPCSAAALWRQRWYRHCGSAFGRRQGALSAPNYLTGGSTMLAPSCPLRVWLLSVGAEQHRGG